MVSIPAHLGLGFWWGKYRHRHMKEVSRWSHSADLQTTAMVSPGWVYELLSSTQVSQSLPLFSQHLIFHRTTKVIFFNSLDHWFIIKGDNSGTNICKTCTKQHMEKGHEASTFSMSKSLSPHLQVSPSPGSKVPSTAP